MHEYNPIKPKNGVLLLAGAEHGTEQKAISAAHAIFKHLNALTCVASVFSMNTNEVPVVDDLLALKAILQNTARCEAENRHGSRRFRRTQLALFC